MPYALPRFITMRPWRRQRYSQTPLALGTLALGVILGGLAFTTALPAAAEPVTTPTLPDGVYAFGEMPEAGQLGTTYMVLEINDQRTVGGFYQPQSSFDCFHGEITDQAMQLTIQSSYEQADYDWSIALITQEHVATQGQVSGHVVPQGFHALPELSNTDHSVLQTCQSVL
jgi:hypothetical protein